MTEERSFYVYMLRCSNGSLYTGYTTDVERRFSEHLSKPSGAKFTRGFRPVEIAAAWSVSGGRSGAMRVESFIKKLSRSEKLKIAFEPDTLNASVNPALGITAVKMEL